MQAEVRSTVRRKWNARIVAETTNPDQCRWFWHSVAHEEGKEFSDSCTNAIECVQPYITIAESESIFRTLRAIAAVQ
jgi:hypothetical protein